MEFLTRLVHLITKFNKWVAYITLTIMFPIVFVFSIARTLGYPIIGDIELVQFAMVLLIMGSLSITEASNSHISIGLIVDKFSAKAQFIVDFIVQILTILFCFVVCLAFVTNMNIDKSSALLAIPYSPFEIFVVIGFLGWLLESLLKLVIGIKERGRNIG